MVLHIKGLWPGHWKQVRNTGLHSYETCACGLRRVLRHIDGYGHQPIDRHWLATGEWREIDWSKVKVPTAPSGIWRPRK